MIRKGNFIGILFTLILILPLFASFTPKIQKLSATTPPSWPISWMNVDWDKNENGPQDDWRDVEYAYYNFDSGYLYLRLECYANPGANWPSGDARYKWFIDIDDNLDISGGNVNEAEYLLFVEDTNDDGSGELYLLIDKNNNGDFEEYEPWPPSNYADYKITDPNIGNFRLTGNFIDMYISWSQISDPPSYGIYWVTDQENPNLNQAPTTDSRDENMAIKVRDVAAISQVANATSVTQGDVVKIDVTVQNLGMQIESFDVTCYFYPTIIGTQRVTNLAAGYITTLTFNWDTSGVPPGTYSIRAFADSAGEITETDETNNLCTAPTTVTVNVHDVAAISQSVNTTSVVKGGFVEVSVTVANLGNFIESFDVACYYDNMVIGTQPVTNLGIGASIDLTFNWDTSGVAPGLYFIKAFADSNREILEYNEENNNCTLITPVFVRAPEGAGILEVDKILVSGPSPAVVGQPATYEITIFVTNVGGSDLTQVNVTDTLALSIDFEVGLGTPSKGTAAYDPDTKTITWNVGILAPSESETLTFTYSFIPDTEGSYTLNDGQYLSAEGFDAAGNEIADSGEGDIAVMAVIRDVKATSQIPDKAIVIQGELVGIDVVVENAGDYYTESFDVTCYYDDTPIEPISVIRVFNLEPSGSSTIKFIWDTTDVPPGNYAIKAFADSKREILESYEENNNCTSTAYIKIVIHDIAVTSQVPDPTEVLQGETVTISVTVKNEGTETESFEVRCFFYGELECCASQVVEDLAPSEIRTLTFVWDTTGVTPGTYYIDAEALPVEGELDTDDNACTSIATVTIKAPPSLPVGGRIIDVADPLIYNTTMRIAAIATVTTLATAFLFLKRGKKRTSLKS